MFYKNCTFTIAPANDLFGQALMNESTAQTTKMQGALQTAVFVCEF